MTDQTVPVPVDLARRLIGSFPAHAATKELKALIPTPPKVGDVLTAVQVYDLPPRSTFVDSDDDVYVVYSPRKIKRVTNVYSLDSGNFDEPEEMDEADAPYSDFNELRVTFIPAPRD